MKRLQSMMLLAAILLSGAAYAAPMQCIPKDNTARILKSPNPNDTADDWERRIHRPLMGLRRQAYSKRWLW